ncbi:MAG: EI24 domain-containing protein [Burkholderiales bacterium]|nr:EI24 domain-containing protein [Burkholderiales bacterium]
MSTLSRSLAYALVHAFHPRMLWLMLWPMLAALALWGTVALFFWVRLALALAETIRGWIETSVLSFALGYADIALFLAHAALALLFVPLVVLTALVILGAFGMPAIVAHVAATRFPALARRGGMSAAASLANSVVALAGMVALGALSLPLWVFPPLWPLIPVAILAWGNQRILRFDALAEHADREEMRALFRAHRGRLYALGFVLALLAYVPVVGLFAPVVVGLAFTHYLLGALEALRRAPIDGAVVRA